MKYLLFAFFQDHSAVTPNIQHLPPFKTIKMLNSIYGSYIWIYLAFALF